jgi:hypothetical protein
MREIRCYGHRSGIVSAENHVLIGNFKLRYGVCPAGVLIKAEETKKNKHEASSHMNIGVVAETHTASLVTPPDSASAVSTPTSAQKRKRAEEVWTPPSSVEPEERDVLSKAHKFNLLDDIGLHRQSKVRPMKPEEVRLYLRPYSQDVPASLRRRAAAIANATCPLVDVVDCGDARGFGVFAKQNFTSGDELVRIPLPPAGDLGETQHLAACLKTLPFWCHLQNHSCDWNTTVGGVTIAATRDIMQGEELTRNSHSGAISSDTALLTRQEVTLRNELDKFQYICAKCKSESARAERWS